MIARLVPLTVFLLWLGCEANFSADVVTANIRFSLQEIKGGIDTFLSSPDPFKPILKVAANDRKAR